MKCSSFLLWAAAGKPTRLSRTIFRVACVMVRSTGGIRQAHPCHWYHPLTCKEIGIERLLIKLPSKKPVPYCSFQVHDIKRTTSLKPKLRCQPHNIFSSERCRQSCSTDCFEILDSAPTKFQLKLKEAMHINWEKPNLNQQVHHVNLTLTL